LAENQSAIRLIDPPSQAIASRRIAISESVLSDFNGLRRHSRVIVTPKPLAPSGIAATLDPPPRFWRRPSLSRVARQSPSQSREEFLLFVTPQSRSRVAHEKRKPGLSALLKNNTSTQPAWQEIVDFS
jgi:hypothetical protein